MNVAREIALNPNIVIYHADDVLTAQIVEAYRAGDGDAPAPIRGLIERGAVSVHMTRYRMRVRKPTDADMLTFLQDVEPALREWSGQVAIGAAPDRMPKRRLFSGPCDATLADDREVHGSSDGAAANQVAEALFSILGVAGVVLTPESASVVKGVLFAWADIAPRVEDALMAATPTEAD
ncbi:hypothetical protein CMK11_15530 [Candidatus Poribacteria bacterium]|nr:hypothetical protein [Candidatus Poribacteria bacterium]